MRHHVYVYLFPECQDHDGSPRSLSRSQRLLFTRCCLSHHFHICHHPLNMIISAWGMQVIRGPLLRDLCPASAWWSQVGLARAVWAPELTCHQNTVLGFSTMGPGRVSAGPGSSPRHCTLSITRSQQVGHMSGLVIGHKIIIFSQCKP